jgi:hypothetical protein
MALAGVTQFEADGLFPQDAKGIEMSEWGSSP